jgi:DNA-directed RNA polymerase subunit H (RpoH/RPB5)
MNGKSNSSTIGNIYKSRNIILEQLKQRGYNISDHEGRSIVEIQSQYNAKPPQLDMLLESMEPNSNKKCFVKYHLTGKIRPNQIYEYIDDIFNIEDILNKDDDFIIVVKDNPNDTLTKLMQDIWNNENIYFSLFNLHNYLYDVLKHECVPQHIELTDEEEGEIAIKYNIMADSQWPEISRFDPVAQSIGLRPNRVCEITRPSETAVTAKYYRKCI